jgi:hypothetical protein
MSGAELTAGEIMGIFLFATATSPALGPTQPPEDISSGVKRPWREANHSFPSSAWVRSA